MYIRNLLHSFKHAFRGLVYTLKTQRNMRIHVYLAIMVILTGVILGLTPIEISVLCCVISFVLIAEIVNTAIETNMDFLHNKAFHPTIKMIKDIFAGVVLIASINAIIVGYIIFSPHLTLFENKVDVPEAIEFRKPNNKIQEEKSEIVFWNQKETRTVPKLATIKELSLRRLG